MSHSDERRTIAVPPALDEVLARPLRHALTDGLSDVPWGVALVVVASLCALGRFWSAGLAYWIPAGIMAGTCVFGVPYATHRLQERFVYPRGGYVSFEPWVSPGALVRYQWLAATAIGLLVTLSARTEMERFWGFGPAVAFLFLATFGQPTTRWPVVVVAFLCAGVGLLTYLDWAPRSSAEFQLMGGFGAWIVAFGLVRFWRFCRKNPRSEVAVDE